MVSKEQVKAAFSIVAAVSTMLHEIKRIPNGHLYAAMMEKGCSLETYEGIIRTIKNAGLIKIENDEIIWIGPDLPRN